MRISHRGQHTSQIGGYGLKHDDWNQQTVLTGHGQHHDRKGNKSDQCHIVCYEHGGEETKSSQQQSKLPCRSSFFQEQISQVFEYADALQSGYYQHETEQQGQYSVIRIRQVFGGGRHEKGRQKGQYSGNAEYGFFL